MSAKRRILLTRPRDRATTFAATLSPLGWDAAIWPLTEIRATGAPPPDPSAYDIVLYTSRAGVEHAPVSLRSLPALCVGDATATAARAAGHVHVKSAGGDAAALADLANREAAGEGVRALHIRGRDVAGDLRDLLKGGGVSLSAHIAYEAAAVTETPQEIRDQIVQRRIDAAAFFSPRASTIFAGLADQKMKDALHGVTAFAISENAAEPLRRLGFGAMRIAAKPDAAAMRAAICGAA